ncbi:hypothetical protein LOTGIDRAFT_173517 [Lottia gigantea]|uniref:Uncharacterized protein n=1 Tax=Lottia gigantea TaxID=225164 RepID=V4AXM8_LOTGI|nr:hypothetical protein LOTGIDRAFT_173517 [Lottia gigantea]ESO99800.1 hypothetical protein LOTGIDRAFT_173517 [Lottia gigantea]
MDKLKEEGHLEEDDIVGVCDTLVQMGIFPKDVRTADGVTSWMSETLKAQSKWPNKSEETERSTGRPSNQIPKLSIFYGESGKGEDVSSHKYDQPTTFDELRVEVRRIEFELNSRKSTADVKPKQSNMLYPLENILDIECAGGNSLPYSGYIEATLETPDLLDNSGLQCLLLVVPLT